MSQFFDDLAIGETIDMSGPWGLIEYLGHGKVGWRSEHVFSFNANSCEFCSLSVEIFR